MDNETKQFLNENFKAINEKFESIDKRFDAIDERFKKQDERFVAQDEIFKKQDERFTAQDERFKKQDERLEAHDKRFDAIDKRFDELIEVVNFIKDNAASQKSVDELTLRVDRIDQRVGKLEIEVVDIKSQMVTKDYLDNKLADLRGDLVVMTRKEDYNVNALVQVLENKNILTSQEASSIVTLSPFPSVKMN